MIYNNLYEDVLINPCKKEGADSLKIIAGYASSAMAWHHLETLKKENINITLLIGMCPKDGVSLSNHAIFKDIMDLYYPEKFSCSYVYNHPQVHSKLYVWYKGNAIYKCFIGSPNYTQEAFLRPQRELISQTSDIGVDDYFKLIEKDSVYCNHLEVEDLVRIYKYSQQQNKSFFEEKDSELSVTVSLLKKDGNVPSRSGINWGQREGRKPNEAYLQLRPEVYKSKFFPSRPQHFTVTTDDFKHFICTRAQKTGGGHAIETPHNNSLLGEYLRNRLGLAYGSFIHLSDLECYGRTDITFYKIDDEHYRMDFSV